MPELPEVETVRMGLVPALEGRTITKALVRRADLRRPFPPRFAARLEGQRVLRLTRRAKYILAELSGGETLVIHLGMSGRMAVYAKGARTKLGNYVYDIGPPVEGKHDHVVLETDAPARIVYTDHRRFGLMALMETAALDDDKLFAGLGPEPLSQAFNAKMLTAALDGRRTPIKSALLDQRIVVGLGNIYVAEALFRSFISPKRLAGSLKPDQIAALVKASKQVLRDAIAKGGSTLRDHAQATGDPGNFQHHFQVYGRAGKPCLHKGCGGVIKRITQAGRSSFYCPVCQK